MYRVSGNTVRMTDLVRVQVTVPMKSAIPADASINTFHFSGLGADISGDVDAIIATLRTFYTTLAPAYSYSVATTNIAYKAFDMEQAQPRVPIDEGLLGVTGGPTAPQGNFPAEMAVVLSFHGIPVSGVNMARRRGRVYVGPVHAGYGAGGSGTDYTRPGGSLITLLRNAGNVLMQSSEAAARWKWVVYSPTNHKTKPILQSVAVVTGGYVDDAWDVQRRRGVDPSTRNTFGTVS